MIALLLISLIASTAAIPVQPDSDQLEAEVKPDEPIASFPAENQEKEKDPKPEAPELSPFVTDAESKLEDLADKKEKDEKSDPNKSKDEAFQDKEKVEYKEPIGSSQSNKNPFGYIIQIFKPSVVYDWVSSSLPSLPKIPFQNIPGLNWLFDFPQSFPQGKLQPIVLYRAEED